MIQFSDAAVKAAKKSLKRQDSGQMKLKDLAKTVSAKVDGNLTVDQVKEVILTSRKFQVDGKLVALTRKRSISPKDPVEELTASSSSKKAKSTSSNTNLDAPAWRKENKIVILHSQDDDEGKQKSAELQNDAIYYPWSSFEGISNTKINSALIEHCTTASGFTKPSPIQAQSWPILTAARDMVGIAETGSGKTLAFALPALSSMATENKNITAKKWPSMLVLAPTRELAMQSAAVLEDFGAVVGLQSLTVYGGVPKYTQVSALKQKNIDCLVATPGRLKDLIQERSCNLSNIRHLVLDEADRMLDMGFEEDVRFIISHCPEAELRQTAMFSATWPAAIRNIAMEYMRDPVRVYVGFESIVGSNGGGDNNSCCAVDDSLSANKRVQQIVEVLEDRQRDSRLREILKQVHGGKKSKDRVLVFALYKKEAERLEQALRRDGWDCCSIHGNKNQQARTTALAEFKDGTCPLLIATDVAARGLDIPNVEAVINYTFPLTIEDYVHRIGRTGRAGKTGVSYTFFQPTDKSHAGELQQVLKQVGQTIPDDLAKFGSTIKKKEHKMYGNFGPKDGITKQATKIKFNYDDDE